MARVLLKRELRTPYGRFGKSIDSEPTEIPDAVIERLKKSQKARAHSLAKDDEERKKALAADYTGLPRDAEIVGDDYKSPAQIAEETGGLGEDGVAMTAAEQEAEINERVNAILDEREAEAKANAEANAPDDGNDDDNDDGDDGDNEDDILDASVSDIVEKLPDLNVEELQDLLDRENAGKTRSTLVVELEAAIEDASE